MQKSIITFLSTTLLVFTFFTTASAQAVLTDTLDFGSQTSTCVQLTKGMTFGSKDSITNGEVSILQFFLNNRGYLQADPTGSFGSATVAAVKAFQGANGITQNGVVGPVTRAKIKEISCGTLANGPIDIATEPSIVSKKCMAVGTRSEGWYDAATGKLIEYANCSATPSTMGGLSVSLNYRSTNSDGTQITVPGGSSATGLDPLATRTWSWTTTGATSVSAKYTISGTNCAISDGATLVENTWMPWLGAGVTGNRFSGSNTRSIGSSYYGCTVEATYQARDTRGNRVSSTVKVAFAEKGGDIFTTYNCNGIVSHEPCTGGEQGQVCAQPPVTGCDSLAGAACLDGVPTRRTYVNKQAMLAAGASYLHAGPCEMTTNDLLPPTTLSCGTANGTTMTHFPGYVPMSYYCTNGQANSRSTTLDVPDGSKSMNWKCSSAGSLDVSCGIKLSYASVSGMGCGQATGGQTAQVPTVGLCESGYKASSVTFASGQGEYLWSCQNNMVADLGPQLCKSKVIDTSCSNNATCNPNTTSSVSISVSGLKSSYKTNEIMAFSVLSSNLPTGKDVNITSVLKRKVDGYVGSIYARQNTVHLQSSKINGLSTQNTTVISSTSTAANNNNLLETLVPGVYTLTTKIVSCEAVQDCASHTAGWWRFNDIGTVYASTSNEVIITDAVGNINPICQFGYTWKIGSDGKTESCVPDYLVFVATSTVNPSYHNEVSRITASNCTIKAGFNTCVSNITLNTAEITTGTMTLVMASSTGKNKDFVYYYNGVYTRGVKTIPVTLGAREERLMLYVNNRLTSQTGASGVCESGTTWNGSVCFSNTAIKKPVKSYLEIWSVGGIIPKSLVLNADAPLKIQMSSDSGSLANGAVRTYKLLVDGVEDRRTKKPSAKQSSLYYEGTPAGFGLTVGKHVFSAQVCNQAGCAEWSNPITITVLPAGAELSSQ